MGKQIAKLTGCLVLGVALAALGAVVNAGPLAAPWIGFVLAAIMIAAGAAVCAEAASFAGVASYFLAVGVATVWITNFPAAGDLLAMPGSWQSRLWPLTAAVAATWPAWVVPRQRQNSSSTRDASGAGTAVKLSDEHSDGLSNSHGAA